MSVVSLSVLVFLCALAIGQVTPCNPHGKTNGCSIPGNLPFFYKKAFRSVCDRHDICYACGDTKRVSRSECDRRFLVNMRARCSREPFWKRGFCRGVAKIYYNAVRKYGGSYYERPSLSYCSNSWVNTCM